MSLFTLKLSQASGIPRFCCLLADVPDRASLISRGHVRPAHFRLQLSITPCRHRAPRRCLPFRPPVRGTNALQLHFFPPIFQAPQRIPALRRSWRMVGSPPLRDSSGLQAHGCSRVLSATPTVLGIGVSFCEVGASLVSCGHFSRRGVLLKPTFGKKRCVQRSWSMFQSGNC